MRDAASSVKAVTLIEEAASLVPTDIAIRDEKDAILTWEAELDEARRVAQQQAEDAERSASASLWSSVWAAVSELAA
jgi:hypothetical protein